MTEYYAYEFVYLHSSGSAVHEESSIGFLTVACLLTLEPTYLSNTYYADVSYPEELRGRGKACFVFTPGDA